METNTILTALAARKSVRVFTPDPVTPDERAAILNAAFQAPTAGNQQLYTILDITDPALKAALADLCDHQPFIAGAPLVLAEIWCMMNLTHWALPVVGITAVVCVLNIREVLSMLDTLIGKFLKKRKS